MIQEKRMTQQLDVIHLILEQQGLLVLLGGKRPCSCRIRRIFGEALFLQETDTVEDLVIDLIMLL